MPNERSAIVIGGGLIGCATAYYLAREGWHVRLLERDRIGSGASSGNCGYICPSHVMPLAAPGAVTRVLRTMMGQDSAVTIRWRFDPALWSWFRKFASHCREAPMMRSARGRHALLKASMELYRQLVAEEGLDCEWQDQGLLLVYKSQKDFDEFGKTATVLEREFGITATSFPGDEVSRLEPTLRPGLAGGWLCPGDAHVRPGKLLANLRRAIEQQGVVVEEGVTVHTLSIEHKQLRSVETCRGSLAADVVVLATGAEAPTFAKPLRCRIPIQPGKGYSLTIPRPRNAPRIPMILEEHHVAITPFVDSLRIGSTMEFAGYDRSLNPKRLALLMRSAQEHLPDVPLDGTAEQWAGLRPMIYDGLPCIDRAPGAENVIVAAGNGIIGLATAPATGKLAAQLASNTEPFIDPKPYSLRRFL